MRQKKITILGMTLIHYLGTHRNGKNVLLEELVEHWFTHRALAQFLGQLIKTRHR